MSDMRILMFDGIRQSNINCVINAFNNRFSRDYNCETLDLQLEKDKLIEDLKLYITKMDFKQYIPKNEIEDSNNIINKLLDIFNVFITSKKNRLSNLSSDYVVSSNYSPFTIKTISLLLIIREELYKFHGNNNLVNNTMDKLFKAISQLERNNDIIPIYRIITLNCFTETTPIGIERGETDSVINYNVRLENIRRTYVITNTLLDNKFLHLRCPEYIRTRVDTRRFITEITLDQNINTIFY